MNERGITPGAIDTGYRRKEDRRLDEFDPDGRNISPGKGESGEPKGMHQKRASQSASHMSHMPEGSTFDMEVISIIRLTRQKLCPVRGCTHQNGGAPFQWKEPQGLNRHVKAKHPEVDAGYILRTMNILIKKEEKHVEEEDRPVRETQQPLVPRVYRK
jgi:hypothetical protein